VSKPLQRDAKISLLQKGLSSPNASVGDPGFSNISESGFPTRIASGMTNLDCTPE
jgi:hypothetical protein